MAEYCRTRRDRRDPATLANRLGQIRTRRHIRRCGRPAGGISFPIFLGSSPSRFHGTFGRRGHSRRDRGRAAGACGLENVVGLANTTHGNVWTDTAVRKLAMDNP